MNEKKLESSIDEILELVEGKKYIKAREIMLLYNEVDIAEILEETMAELGIEQAIILFRTLPKDVSVEVFAYLPIDDQIKIINKVTDKETAFILDELSFDDMINVLEELPANVVDKILENTPKEERKQINTFLNYPDNCAGSLMTPDYISLRKEMTVAEALGHIKKEGMDRETIYTCYVKDGGRKLQGIVSLRMLVISDSEIKISELMHEEFICVNVYDDQEEVSEVFRKYGFLAMPVVDSEKRLVGIITIDDILDVIEEEATEDFEKMAALNPSEDPYLKTKIIKLARNRIVWLLLLMLSATITGSVISGFESSLALLPALVAFIPMLMDTGGNAGSQSSTLIIRGMAIGEIKVDDVLKVLWREIRIAVICGTALGLVNFVRIYLMNGRDVLLALTVTASLFVTVLMAKSVGCLLPILAKKLKIDPAIMAAPLITTIVDAASLIVYFSIAKVILDL